jgi:hypothetical protein
VDVILQGVETVDTSFFITEENQEKLERARKTNSVQVRQIKIHLNINVAASIGNHILG